MPSSQSATSSRAIQTHLHRIETLFGTSLDELNNINASLGLDPAEIANGLEHAMETSMSAYISDMQTRLQDLKRQCEDEAQGLNTYRLVLSDVPIAAPVENLNPPYVQLLAKLKEARGLYISTWEKRLVRRRTVVAAASELYDKLQECPASLLAEITYEKECVRNGQNVNAETRTGSLSLEVICDLETCFDDMKQMMATRVAVATELCSRIFALWDLLGVSDEQRRPELSNPEQYISEERQNELLAIQNELETLKQTREAQIAGLTARVEHLWSMLDIDPSQRTMDSTDQTPTETVIAGLEAELERLEVQKREHMDRVIRNMRAKIETLWSKLMLGETEKSREFVDNTDFNDDALEAHEREISRLTALLQDPKRRQVLARVHAYDELCRMELELAEAAKDPERFKRRGTQLIEEGRKRSLVANRKPGVVKELVKLLKEWESEHDGEPLLIRGENLAVLLQDTEQKILLGLNRRSSLPKSIRDPSAAAAAAAAAAAMTAPAANRLPIRTTKPRLVQHSAPRALTRAPRPPAQPRALPSAQTNRSQTTHTTQVAQTTLPVRATRPVRATQAPHATQSVNLVRPTQTTQASRGAHTLGGRVQKPPPLRAPRPATTATPTATTRLPTSVAASAASAATASASTVSRPRPRPLVPPRSLRPRTQAQTETVEEKKIPQPKAPRVAKTTKPPPLRPPPSRPARALANGVARALQENQVKAVHAPLATRPPARPLVSRPLTVRKESKENMPSPRRVPKQVQPARSQAAPMSPGTMFQNWRGQELQRLRSLRQSYGGGDSSVSDMSHDAY